MTERTTALVGHYQKTYELTYTHWRQRNRTFLILLGVISVATLLIFGGSKTDSMLVYFIAKLVGATDAAGREAIRQGLPFGLVQSILLMVVFYLTVNLYHRALYVLRSYRYLGRLEQEIRQDLALPADSIAFTRESSFYWNDRPPLSGWVKWIYILMLGLLLLAFLGARIIGDFHSHSYLLGLVDLIIALPTLLFFYAYARSSVSLDSQ